MMTLSKQKKYMEILAKVDTILQEHGISSWLDAGTLLGAYRDGSLAHEHDVDIGFLGEDYTRLQALEPEFKKIGLITETPLYPEFVLHHFKLYYPNKEHLIDLIPWYQLDDKIRSCVGVRLPFVMPKEFFESWTKIIFSKLSKYRFRVPARTEEYLERYYGPGWRKPMTHEAFIRFQKDCVNNIAMRPEVNKPYPDHKRLWVIWQAKHGGWEADLSSIEAGIPYQPIKLNLGCGGLKMEGYINCDMCATDAVGHNLGVDLLFDAKQVPFEDNSVDEVWTSHLIEHFDFHEGLKALKEWYRVLKPGGHMVVECPDFEAFCRNFLNLPEDHRVRYYEQVWGYPWEPGQAHKFGYTPTQLKWSLEVTGFKNLQQLPAYRFTNLVDWCQKFVAEK